MNVKQLFLSVQTVDPVVIDASGWSIGGVFLFKCMYFEVILLEHYMYAICLVMHQIEPVKSTVWSIEYSYQINSQRFTWLGMCGEAPLAVASPHRNV